MNTQIPTPPALVFTGEYDPFTTPERVRRFASRLQSSVFTTIQKADHLFHMEQFDATSSLVHRFMSEEDLDGLEGCNEMEYFGELAETQSSSLVSPVY